jgi:hypothetical protein
MLLSPSPLCLLFDKFGSQHANGFIWPNASTSRQNFGVRYTSVCPALVGFTGERGIHFLELVRLCENLFDRLSGS